MPPLFHKLLIVWFGLSIFFFCKPLRKKKVLKSTRPFIVQKFSHRDLRLISCLVKVSDAVLKNMVTETAWTFRMYWISFSIFLLWKLKGLKKSPLLLFFGVKEEQLEGAFAFLIFCWSFLSLSTFSKKTFAKLTRKDDYTSLCLLSL